MVAGGVVTGVTVGVDTIVYTVTDLSTGCSSTVTHVTYVKPCNVSSVPGVTDTRTFDLHPNPNNGRFTLSGYLPNADRGELEILNVTGAVIHRETVRPVDHQLDHELDVTAYGPGIYLVMLRTGEGTIVRKFAVQ